MQLRMEEGDGQRQCECGCQGQLGSDDEKTMRLPTAKLHSSDQMTLHSTSLMKFLYRSACCAPKTFMTEVIDPSFGLRSGQSLTLMMEEGSVFAKSSAHINSLKESLPVGYVGR